MTDITERKNEVTYEAVAASQTAQVMGPNGNAGDYLERLVVSFTTTTNAVAILDGATTLLTVTNAATVGPHVIEVGAFATHADGWKITTGANTAVIAIGKFS